MQQSFTFLKKKPSLAKLAEIYRLLTPENLFLFSAFTVIIGTETRSNNLSPALLEETHLVNPRGPPDHYS